MPNARPFSIALSLAIAAALTAPTADAAKKKRHAAP
ncbi:MAG: hypothetical protein JWL98_1162, partial [Xanthomonadaceae bacterium]|nr:hypothetical protein [Xanthomonadaceae bacterium]